MGLGDLTKKAQQGIDQAGQGIQDNVVPTVQEGVQTGIESAKDAAPVVGDAIKTGAEKGIDVAKDVGDKAGDAVDDIKDTVKDATQNLNPVAKFDQWIENWMGKAKWVFWIVIILVVLYGLMRLLLGVARIKWAWNQIFGKDKKDGKFKELEREVRKENKIEIVKESPLVKSEYKSQERENTKEETEDIRDALERSQSKSKTYTTEELLKEVKSEGLKEKLVNTSPKSFVEELKEKVQPGETNLKPSDLVKKRGRKKKNETETKNK